MPKKRTTRKKREVRKKAHRNSAKVEKPVRVEKPVKVEIRESSARKPDYELKRQDIMERLQRLDPSFVPKEPPRPLREKEDEPEEEPEEQEEKSEEFDFPQKKEKEKNQKSIKKNELALPKLPKKNPLEKTPDGEDSTDEDAPALRAEEVIPIKTQDLEEKNAKLIEKYNIEVDKAIVSVEIKQTERGVKYYLHVPKIDIATTSLLNEIRNELISITTISMKELTDPNSLNTIKKRFMNDAQKILRENLPNLQQKSEDFLIGKLMQDMLGLGSIEFLINDPNLEEIVITSSTEPIRVFSKKYGWVSTNLIIEKEEEIVNYANIIARRVGRQINVLNPLLDAHLVTGDRINAVLYPINTKGNTITVRKFARDPFTIIDLIKSKTCDLDTAALLWLAIEYEMNILISGGTASGKTVFLNACMPFIPPNQRIISIEDTRELMLPQFLYWTPLVTRTPNAEGKGEVSMLHLLINSLRMRPDRIVLGEMRKHEEAMVLFEAMHTGHSVYATVHADSAAETVSRLTNPPLNVPPNLLRSVNLNVIMFRDRRKGIRRVLQVAEFEAGKDDAKANILYRWSPEEDRIIKHSESSRFFEEVSRHTGMSEQEINKALEEKKNILSWLVKNEMRSLREVGKVMDIYYKNKENLMNIISKNDKKSIV